MTVKWLRGGLGDICQKLGNIRKDERYVVFSHLKQSADLVSVYTKNFQFKEMIGLVGRVPNEVESEPYPPLLIPEESIRKAQREVSKDKRIIGIHPIGSKPSREYDVRTRRPQKLMSSYFIETVMRELDDGNTEFLMFCAPSEIELYKSYSATLVAEPYIWDCIAKVSMCDLVIAVDSAIKTFSAIQHIPTIVVLGDYDDEVRKKFIDPYKEILPIPFTNMDAVVDKVIKEAKKILE